MSTSSLDKLSEVWKDPRKLKTFFAHAIPLTEFLEESHKVSSTLPCPFHDDSSPSAKIFHDPDGTVRLYCFTEHRQFTSFDYVTSVLGKDPLLFLYERFSVSEMEGILNKVDFTITKRSLVVDEERIRKSLEEGENPKDFLYTLFNIREKMKVESK